jgi:hypothetical protein
MTSLFLTGITDPAYSITGQHEGVGLRMRQPESTPKLFASLWKQREFIFLFSAL